MIVGLVTTAGVQLAPTLLAYWVLVAIIGVLVGIADDNGPRGKGGTP